MGGRESAPGRYGRAASALASVGHDHLVARRGAPPPGALASGRHRRRAGRPHVRRHAGDDAQRALPRRRARPRRARRRPRGPHGPAPAVAPALAAGGVPGGLDPHRPHLLAGLLPGAAGRLDDRPLRGRGVAAPHPHPGPAHRAGRRRGAAAVPVLRRRRRRLEPAGRGRLRGRDVGRVLVRRGPGAAAARAPRGRPRAGRARAPPGGRPRSARGSRATCTTRPGTRST